MPQNGIRRIQRFTFVVLWKMNSSMVSVVLRCTFYDNVQLKAHLLIDVHGIWIFSCTYTILVKKYIKICTTSNNYICKKIRTIVLQTFWTVIYSMVTTSVSVKLKAPYGIYNIVIACPLSWPFLAGILREVNFKIP